MKDQKTIATAHLLKLASHIRRNTAISVREGHTAEAEYLTNYAEGIFRAAQEVYTLDGTTVQAFLSFAKAMDAQTTETTP